MSNMSDFKQPTVEQLIEGNSTLVEVNNMYYSGRITREVWDGYKHEWQTRSPRFSVQACYCDSCKQTGPISDI